MRLFKFRSLERTEHVLDIVFKERLHCAPYDQLNDPFEGVFLSVIQSGGLGTHPLGSGPLGAMGETTIAASISQLQSDVDSRVCSLSETMNDVRLWSHYANGHRGIAIEIELEDVAPLHQVSYREKLAEFSGGFLSKQPTTIELLTMKTKHWEYEKEYRLITGSEFYDVRGRIKGVFLGLRISEVMQRLMLRSTPAHVPVFATKLNTRAVTVEVRQQLER